jgi:hypothetical protein
VQASRDALLRGRRLREELGARGPVGGGLGRGVGVVLHVVLHVDVWCALSVITSEKLNGKFGVVCEIRAQIAGVKKKLKKKYEKKMKKYENFNKKKIKTKNLYTWTRLSSRQGVVVSPSSQASENCIFLHVGAHFVVR